MKNLSHATMSHSSIVTTKPLIAAVLFDLDGVLTDTAEFHFLAWKRLADEIGVPFDRAQNERMRGVPRRASLDILLEQSDLPVSEEQAQAWMERKNHYYRELLQNLTPQDLLPGVRPLLDELRRAGLKIAIASASKNSPDVIARLGLDSEIDLLAHGGSVDRQKPYPDLFLYAARKLGLPPTRCLVVEDAAAGIEAAHAAGMPAVGIGPEERVGQAEVVFPSLEGVSASELLRAATWRVSEPSFDLAQQHHRETLFTIGNGYLGTRGTLEERAPKDKQATLVHGFWDDAPIVLTELVNTPDWTAMDVLVNGERFSLENGLWSDYARWLDLRDGTLHRRLVWQACQDSPPVELRFERFASLHDPHVLAMQCQITALAAPVHLEIHCCLNGYVENEGLLHLNTTHQNSRAHQMELEVETRSTHKKLALCAQVETSGNLVEHSALDCLQCPGVRLVAHLEKGGTVVVNKLVSVFTSRDTAAPLDAAREKASQALRTGYEQLKRANANAWSSFWERSDVIIEGDDLAQLAVRHALFQLRIAAPNQDEFVSIPAKTLSGFGYRGHVFWDSEIFALPFFTFTQPQLARNMLMYRWHTLPGARRKAKANGYPGAQYPWESAETGDEVTPAWVPAFDERTKLIRIWTGDLQLHITTDVVYAMHQYWRVTGDDRFWVEVGAPVVLETALFWEARVEPEGERFSIRNVIGCDEYHDNVDNNAFTNAMVRWHLLTALETFDWLQAHAPDKARELATSLDINEERLAHWQNVSENIVILYDEKSGLIEQFEGFFNLKEVDWSSFEGRSQSMQVLLGIEGANEHQVLKQPDVIALFCLLPEQFDEKTWRANWEYYTPRTDHTYGSSLGPAMHAWVAARLGLIDQAYEHFMRAALTDLENIRGNAGDGIHAGSAGGLWQAIVFGFAGLHLNSSGPQVSPCLPAHWKRLAFNVWIKGQRYRFDLRPEKKLNHSTTSRTEDEWLNTSQR